MAQKTDIASRLVAGFETATRTSGDVTRVMRDKQTLALVVRSKRDRVRLHFPGGIPGAPPKFQLASKPSGRDGQARNLLVDVDNLSLARELLAWAAEHLMPAAPKPEPVAETVGARRKTSAPRKTGSRARTTAQAKKGGTRTKRIRRK
jgi:hypothetical protein